MHCLPPFPKASLSPSSKSTLVPPCLLSDLPASSWFLQTAHFLFFPTEQNVFLHSWTITDGAQSCHLSWIFCVYSCSRKLSLGLLMPLGTSSLSLVSLPLRCSVGASRRKWPSIGVNVLIYSCREGTVATSVSSPQVSLRRKNRFGSTFWITLLGQAF